MYKNNSSTKGNTVISGDSEDAAGCSDGIEAPDLSNSFKLIKRDLYLERQQENPKDDFTELQAIMGLTPV